MKLFLYYNICMRRVYLEEVDSTNKWAKEHISELEHLSVVYTYKQTAGRGRLERKWDYAGSDNIYASIVIKPNSEMLEVYSNLTQYLSLVLSEVLETYKLIYPPKIKWPNDVRINGKKISGILAEGVNLDNGKIAIVLGFGVNLNCTKEFLSCIDQPATSLNIETGMEIEKESFFNMVLEKFCLMYDKFIGEGFLSIRDDYIRRAEFLNKNIKVRIFDRIVAGKAVDITEKGALNIIDENNNLETLLVGDIL